MVKRYFRNGMMYEFHIDFDPEGKPIQQLRVVTEGKTVYIPVKFLNGYTVKINKRSIAAEDGASGLFAFISRCIEQDFMLLYVNKIIEVFC